MTATDNREILDMTKMFKTGWCWCSQNSVNALKVLLTLKKENFRTLNCISIKLFLKSELIKEKKKKSPLIQKVTV